MSCLLCPRCLVWAGGERPWGLQEEKLAGHKYSVHTEFVWLKEDLRANRILRSTCLQITCFSLYAVQPPCEDSSRQVEKSIGSSSRAEHTRDIGQHTRDIGQHIRGIGQHIRGIGTARTRFLDLDRDSQAGYRWDSPAYKVSLCDRTLLTVTPGPSLLDFSFQVPEGFFSDHHSSQLHCPPEGGHSPGALPVPQHAHGPPD